jgi:S-adenosyl methyltransferase
MYVPGRWRRMNVPGEEGAAMTGDESPVPHEVGVPSGAGQHAFDTSRAHQARMYDYFLGGKDNYAADRDAAEAWLKIDPKAAFSSRANRAFLGRAVRYLAGDAGMRQFLDIGTGIPCRPAVTSPSPTWARTSSAPKP